MSDVYKIGVAIAVNSNGAAVLGALASGLKNVDKLAAAATGRMNALKAATIGALGVAAGLGTLHVMGNMVRHGSTMVHQQNMLRRAGLDNQKIAEATARAWQTTQMVPGSIGPENLKLFGELRTQVSSDRQALDLMPDLARLGLLMQNETGKTPELMAQTVMRVLEQRGHVFGSDGHTMDLDKVRIEMGRMYQAISASHGAITPETFASFQSMAGPAGMALSADAYYGLMPTAMQTLKGNKAGTALTSLFAQFVGGVMTQRSALELANLHLLDKSKMHVRRGGQVTLDPGAIKGFDASNPFTFFAGPDSPFQKAVAKYGKGGDGGHALESLLDPKMVRELYRGIGRETTRRIISDFIGQAPTFERDFRLRTQTMTPEAAEKEAAHDPMMAMTRFTNAWDNLLTALGVPMVDKAIEVLGKLTDIINRLAVWATANPDTIEKFGIAVAGLASSAVVGGGLAVLTAALTALTGPAGLVALAGGIVILADSLKHGDNPVAQELAKYLPQEKDIIPAFFEFGKRVVWHLADATLRVGTEIGHALRASFDEHIARPVVEWASTGLSAAASAVTSGLSHITQAIMSWVAGIPSAIAGTLGLKSATPGGPAPSASAAEAPHSGAGGLINPADPNSARPGGSLFHKGSFVPPAANNNHVTLINYTVLDGKVIAKDVSSHMARSGSGPSGGTTGFDARGGFVGGMSAA